MPIRWIQSARVSLQRVGAVLAVVAVAPESRSVPIEWVVRNYSEVLTRRVPVPETAAGDVAAYVHHMHLWQRYKELRGLEQHEIAGRPIEAQDLWLADPMLPSASGAVTERVFEEPAQLAVSLRLLRSSNHTLTDRGKAVRLLAEPQMGALRGKSQDPNPMLVNPGLGLVVLRALLEADYDFVRATHRVAVPHDQKSFTRSDVSIRMGEVCRLVREENRRRVRTGDDRQRLARLVELAESIDSADKAPTRGGARPPDQTSTVRLEPYVDLGLVGRKSRFDYTYSLDEHQREFFASIIAEESADTWASEHLVGRYVAGRTLGLAEVEPSSRWDAVRQAWRDLRSPMGYASIEESMLLANARLIDSGAGYFELGAGLQALRDLHRAEPKSVRFTMARGGAVSYFRLTETGTEA